MLIVFEGVDGSGKQTHAELIYKRLAGEGKKIKRISFPDYKSDSSALVKMYLSGAFGQRPNDVNPYAASSFYAVDRIASYLANWKADLQGGKMILADRYTTSNAVHQAGKLIGEKRDKYLDWLFDFEYNLLGLPNPDLVIFLSMPPKHSAGLISKRCNKANGESEKDIHEKDFSYLNRAYNNALYVAKRFNWSIVNCVEENSIRTIEDINNDIYNLIKETCKFEFHTD
ncbi:MAG: thymidylate kinase [Firmicutes bacterium]|nr:thymidylate kinase [Bacillota bacterium]